MNCSNIVQLSFSEAIKLILGKNVFNNCPKLKMIGFVYIKLIEIGNECFKGSSINHMSLQGETITIGSCCFQNCSSINNFELKQAQNVKIHSGAFKFCKNLTNVTIEVASSIEIHDECFYKDQNLKRIKLNGNDLNIGKNCFCYCTSIESFSVNSESVYLGEKAFSECNSIKTANIISTNKFEAGSYCFNNAKKLTTFLITSKNVKIKSFCFANCEKMNEFNISFGENAEFENNVFSSCNNLSKCSINASEKFKASTLCFNNTCLKKILITSKLIIIGDRCFDKSFESIICHSANEIQYFDSSFDGSRFDQHIDTNNNRSTRFIPITVDPV